MTSVKLTPSHKLYGLGAILLVALTICSRNFSSMGAPSFIIPLAVAGIAYLLAVREFFSTPTFPKRVIVIGLVLAALWHLLFLVMPPGPDDDIHRYVWDGRVQRLGYNPYILVPSDPALAGLHTSETRTLNNPDVPSPYPAGAQLFFRAVTAIHESVFALKVAFVVCDLAIVFVLLDVLHTRRQAAHWVLAYAWNPLLATEVAGSGHIDIVGALLLLVSAVALARRWRAFAAVAFGLAVAVKLLPIVLLPLYWKRVRVRDGALAAVVLGLLYVPFLNHGRIPIGSLGTYVQSFRFNDPVFTMLESSGGSAACSWAGSARRLLYRNLDEKKVRSVVRGRFCLADGSIAPMCASCISMVPALAAAVPAICFDAAAHHLDGEHYPYLLRLASAHTWTSVVSSWLDYAAGIRVSGSGRCNYRVVPLHATSTARTTGSTDRCPSNATGWPPGTVYRGSSLCPSSNTRPFNSPRRTLHDKFEPSYGDSGSASFWGTGPCCNFLGADASGQLSKSSPRPMVSIRLGRSKRSATPGAHSFRA